MFQEPPPTPVFPPLPTTIDPFSLQIAHIKYPAKLIPEVALRPYSHGSAFTTCLILL